MVTTYTKTVGTASRDYSTITLAEADIATIATSADLVSNDEEVIFDIYNDSTFTEHLTVSGTTTDATRTVTFRAASGEGHDGTLGTGVFLNASGTPGHAIDCSDSHIRFNRLHIRSGKDASDECIRISNSAVGLQIENCLFQPDTITDGQQDGVYGPDTDVGSATYPILVRNCYFIGFDRAGVNAQNYNASTPGDHYFDIVNCTFANCEFGVGWRCLHASSVAHLKVINCVSGDMDVDDMGQTGTTSGTLDTTGSSDNFGESTGTVGTASFPDNTAITYTASLTPGAGSWCIVQATGDLGTGDHRIVDDTDNDVLDAGVGPASESLVATYDARGTARGGATTDPGFYQVSAVTAVDLSYLRRYEHTPAPNTHLRM